MGADAFRNDVPFSITCMCLMSRNTHPGIVLSQTRMSRADISVIRDMLSSDLGDGLTVKYSTAMSRSTQQRHHFQRRSQPVKIETG